MCGFVGCLWSVSEPEGSHIVGERRKRGGLEGRVEGDRGCRKPWWACGPLQEQAGL